MKRQLGWAAALLLVAGHVWAQDELPKGNKAAPRGGQPAAGQPGNVKDQASYGIGLTIGRNLKAQDVDLNIDMLVRGLQDALNGRQPALTDEQIRSAMMEFEQQLMAQVESRMKAEGEKNLKAGQTFLAENKKKEGVVALPSGLQYKVLKQGAGKQSPAATDQVKVHYHGTLIDGTVFDSSIERGEPLTIPLNGVIDGWTQALTKMKVGDRWRLFIPPDLAYGANPQPGSPIGPNAVLIFDVELLEIVK